MRAKRPNSTSSTSTSSILKQLSIKESFYNMKQKARNQQRTKIGITAKHPILIFEHTIVQSDSEEIVERNLPYKFELNATLFSNINAVPVPSICSDTPSKPKYTQKSQRLNKTVNSKNTSFCRTENKKAFSVAPKSLTTCNRENDNLNTSIDISTLTPITQIQVCSKSSNVNMSMKTDIGNNVSVILKNNNDIPTKNEHDNTDLGPSCSNASPTKKSKLVGKMNLTQTPHHGDLINKSEKFKKPNYTPLVELIKLVDDLQDVKHLKNILKPEIEIFRKYFHLEKNAQYVLLKLFTYKQNWYNLHKFCQRISLHDSQDYQKIYMDIYDKGFVDQDHQTEDQKSRLKNLDVSQLKDICRVLKVSLKLRQNQKEKLIEAILNTCSKQLTMSNKSLGQILEEQITEHMGFSMKMKQSVYDAFQTVITMALFTSNSINDLEKYMLNVVYRKSLFPTYHIQEYVVFYTRDECLSYVKARERAREYEEPIKRNVGYIETLCEEAYNYLQTKSDQRRNSRNRKIDEERFVEAPHLKRFSAEHTYISLLSQAMTRLTRSEPLKVKEWLEFLIKEYNRSHRLGGWYVLLIMLYTSNAKLKDYKMAGEVLLRAFRYHQEYLNELARYELGERARKIMRPTRNPLTQVTQLMHDNLLTVIPPVLHDTEIPEITIEAHGMRGNAPSRKRDYVEYDRDGTKYYRKVEEVAVQFYTNECDYSHGLHCEGEIVKATFTLFFWDIIYNPSIEVPGVFLQKIQSAPLDMFTKYFYINRKELIDKRIQEIRSEWSNEHLVDFAKDMWTNHAHEYSVFGEVKVVIADVDLLETILQCFDRLLLAKIYERLVKDIRLYGKGMPDLFLWNIETKKCKFVEVKGENDRLSIGQILWLKYLVSNNGDAEVCHVHSIGSKRKTINRVSTESTVEDEENETYDNHQDESEEDDEN